jgi:hypothetical protein
MEFALTWEQWLLIGRAAFLVVCFLLAAVSFSAWRRSAARQNEQFTAHYSELLKRLDGLDARHVALRTAVAQLSEGLERSGRDTASQRALPGYPIAIRLARGGARPDELVSSCGLSVNEAELVCRLHGAPRAASA